jgi:glycyl-tRNA synthetase beta chain
MTELFIELRTEEIPARFQKQGAVDFLNLITSALKAEGITATSQTFCVSPCHLAIQLLGLPQRCEDRIEERRGPRIDAPETAIQGFLTSVRLTREQCESRKTPKGTFLFAHLNVPGKSVTDILPALIERALFHIPWPNSMRWGASNKSWIRPIRSGICLFGGQPVSFTITLGEEDKAPQLRFGDTTVGHRFLSPQPFVVNGFDDFKEKLEQAFVKVDHVQRQQCILEQARHLAHEKGLRLVEDLDLLEEVTGLVEWPVALMGRINSAFMALPSAVLMTVMRVHQRYFSLQDQNGHLAPWFIVISNMVTRDKGAQIILGNERVLNARLADAQFFYDLDVQTPLTHMAENLARITFHADLGTMAEKKERLIELAGHLAKHLHTDEMHARQAAALLKADLVSKMVEEFPELQGVMGQAYAHAQGYQAEVATAIAEHYLPKFVSDPCPGTLLGQICALADRIDTLVGFFALNIRPTGSKDPFALRRATLGLIRILEDRHDLVLKDLFTFAYGLYRPIFARHQNVKNVEGVVQALEDFLLDRLKVLWREQGLRHDIIAASFASGLSTPIRLLKKRAEALQHFFSRPDQAGDNLLKAYRRACHIVQIEENKERRLYTGSPDQTLFQQEAERLLFQAFENSHQGLNHALATHDFEAAMNILAALRPVIDRYFNEVMVNSPDAHIRENRLQTLSLLRTTLKQVADFSQIMEA